MTWSFKRSGELLRLMVAEGFKALLAVRSPRELSLIEQFGHALDPMKERRACP